MAALDTNVLVRFLVGDDLVQSKVATAFIQTAVSSGALFVPVTVTLELEWVLRSAFGFDKAAVTGTIFQLLGSFDLAFESEGAVETALAQYQEGSAEFSDCLHAALAVQANEQPWWTFDRAASRLPGARFLRG